ncbi:zinc finger protein 414 isoform X3 [Myotis yumanensis]|uniref:zinc finger protein 414 isoform X3 n=1 Tax=Myotis yumanensis TaxID=159337 RepID=UPI0038D0AE04
MQSPAPVRPRRKCPQAWPLQPPPSPWGRRQGLTRQPHPHCGIAEGLEGPSRAPPQPQARASLALDLALAPPAQSLGPVRTCGLPGDAHRQESRYPAPALAAASVSQAFVTWHSICVPTAHPHSPWKVGSESVVGGRQSSQADPWPPHSTPLSSAPALPGKLFRCSALNCTETFPSMQELVAHGKLHYKPNRYFKCENCLLRFRTHRSLFKHLHVCAEHAQSPAPPPAPALDKEPSALERPTESDSASATGWQHPLPEPYTAPAPAPSGPFLPYLNPASFGLNPTRLRPFMAAAPGLPASSAAVWKKSQGAGGSPRRSQGGSDAPSASRPAMTLHLEDHRSIAPGQPHPDCPVGKVLEHQGGEDGGPRGEGRG